MKQPGSRIKTKTSRTAQLTCVSRAVSFCDSRPLYQGPDWVALALVPGFMGLLLKCPLVVRLFGRFGSPRGIYEYVIARTRFMDAQFQAALAEGFDQVLIFGAGFDSRAIRFAELNKATTIFELDAPIIQKEKRRALTERDISLPGRLVFAAINFNQESLADKLAEAGYRPGLRTLYLLEGLTMYLNQESVDQTFGFIGRTAGPGSRAAFDFVRAEARDNPEGFYGGQAIAKMVDRAGEGWTFFMAQEEAAPFLTGHGFNLVERLDSREMEKRYFSDAQGQLKARVNATHGLVLGEKQIG